ncbi:MAG: HD domain-containing protein [Candidatus Rokubacteria bacterium]|nr:HD domain-containing protein [Candidatus Rokubacteria bacterium]
MSDLVRGIHRGGGEPPAREAPPAAQAPGGAPPPAEASRPPRVRFPPEPAAAPPAAAPPEPEPAAGAEAPAAEAATGEGAEQLFTELLAFTGRLPALAREGREFPWGWLQRLLERVVRSLEGSADLFWLANNPPPGGAEYLAAHLTAVGVLSIQIGRGLGHDRERLLDLATAAFLFDVGVASLPAGADPTAYQTHAQLGAEIVRRWAPPRAGIVEAVLQHHERENGRGYPQGLAGAAIHPNAKVIALMDTYTALIFPRPPAPRLQPYQAVRQIVSSKHEDFPTPLIKALLAEISVFPPRTVVKLNTGEVGRVIAVNRAHPLRPKVEIVADSKGHPLPAPKILDLAEAPFIYVMGPVQEG